MRSHVLHHLTDTSANALQTLIAARRRAAPQAGLLALVAESEQDCVAPLQAACRQLGMPLLGAIFPALIVDDELRDCGVWLIELDPMPAYGLLAALHTAEADAARLSAALNPALGDDRPTLFMLLDAQLRHTASLLDALYLKLADRVHYLGVNAGSESFRPLACLFDATRRVDDGAGWLLLPPGIPTALEHGYPAPSQVMTATSTVGNRIVAIDWEPAFEAYRRLIGSSYGIELNRDNFYRYATHFPVGILRACNEVLVRIPVVLEDDGSLFCIGEVPANSVLTVLAAPPAGADCGLNRLLEHLGPPAPNDELLLFYCAGRRLHFGSYAGNELAGLRAASGSRRLAGALSLGEIGGAGSDTYPLFHNAALVCARLPSP